MRAPLIIRLRRRLRRFQQLSWRERGLLVQAMVSLVVAGVLLRLVPFERLTNWLCLRRAETPPEEDAHAEKLAAQIGWAIDAAANRSPLEFRCLPRALAATLVSRRYHLATTLYLGVTRAESGELKAHAWARCGSCVITGRSGQERFSVIACFSRAVAVMPGSSLTSQAG
jgi:hypothetical protein